MPAHAPDERVQVSRHTQLTFPRWLYLPGKADAADMARLEPAKATVGSACDPGTVQKQTAFLFGADLFNAGYFWEAHEVWEPVWLALPPNSRERLACQALIQAANACVKLRYGRTRAFTRVAGDVARLAGEATLRDSFVAGLDLDAWADRFAAFAESIRAGQVPDEEFDTAETDGFPLVAVETA